MKKNRGHVEVVYVDDLKTFDPLTGQNRRYTRKEFRERLTNVESDMRERTGACVEDWYEYLAACALNYKYVEGQTGPNLCPTWLLKAALWLRGVRFPRVESTWIGPHSLVVKYSHES